MHDRPSDALARDAGGIRHRDLAFTLHPVERVEHGEEHRERQDQRDQLRYGEDRHPGEGEAGATVGDDQVELVQALRQDRDRRERAEDGQERAHRLAKHIGGEGVHPGPLAGGMR